MGHATLSPEWIAGASNPGSSGTLLAPGFSAPATHLSAGLGGVSSLSEAVAVVFHRQIEQAPIDFDRKNRVVEIELTNHLILQIHNIKRCHDPLHWPAAKPVHQLYCRFLRTIK